VNFYVFRIAKGHAGGEIVNDCPIEIYDKEDEIKNKLEKTEIEGIPYGTNNYIDYLHRELWQCGKLRQGWGIEGLDLTLFDRDKTQWIENYIVGAKKYWGEEIREDYCHIAMGRYNILKYMKEADKNSLIFIPKHSLDNHHDESSFTVCRVVGQYYFDLDMKYKDFGHVLIVKDIKSYKYSETTLLAGDFKGYRRALGQISGDHQLFN
jgi:hypothetical protein